MKKERRMQMDLTCGDPSLRPSWLDARQGSIQGQDLTKWFRRLATSIRQGWKVSNVEFVTQSSLDHVPRVIVTLTKST